MPQLLPLLDHKLTNAYFQLQSRHARRMLLLAQPQKKQKLAMSPLLHSYVEQFDGRKQQTSEVSSII